MANTLENTSILDVLPINLVDDEQIIAASKAFDNEKVKIQRAYTLCNILSDLESLTNEALDILAWQWHIENYDSENLNKKQKCSMIQQSLRWHQKKGTRKIVEESMSVIYENTCLEEWYEYAGKPYHFKISTGTTQSITEKNIAKLIQVINMVKNERSWLDEITLKRKSLGTTFFSSAKCVHKVVRIGLYRASIPPQYAKIYIKGARHIHKEVVING